MPSRYSTSVLTAGMRGLHRGKVVHRPVTVPETRGGGQRPAEILTGLTDRAGEVHPFSERGGDGRRERAAGPVRTGRRDPAGPVLVDAFLVDEQVDDRIFPGMAAFDHHGTRPEFHDASSSEHPVLRLRIARPASASASGMFGVTTRAIGSSFR